MTSCPPWLIAACLGPDGHPLSRIAVFMVTACGITHILQGIIELTIGKLYPHWIYEIPQDQAPTP